MTVSATSTQTTPYPATTTEAAVTTTPTKAEATIIARSDAQSIHRGCCGPRQRPDICIPPKLPLPTPTPPKENPIFERLEKLMASLTKLIEAFAKLTSAKNAAADEPVEVPAPAVPKGQVETTQPTTPEVDGETTDVGSTPSVDEPPSVEDADDVPPVDGESQVEDINLDTIEEAPVEEPQAPTIDLGKTINKTGDFLWKPVSDKDGNLAVLLPPAYTGRVKEIRILSADGSKTLQRGRYSGVGNGGREHYRFSKPGAKFPDGAIVLVTLEDGTTRHLTIKDTAKRITR